jgi:hypothetical protein
MILKAGAKAPAFTLDDMSGGKKTLPDMLARGPVLLALYKINDESGTRRFQGKFGVTVPTLLDREGDGYPVSNEFGISHVPSLFLVEPDGTISLSSEGYGRLVEGRKIELPVEAAR